MSSKSEIQKQKRGKLIQVLDAYLEAKGEDYITAYFSSNEKYRVQLKVVDEQLQAFLDDENIRQIGEIDYEAVAKVLSEEKRTKNLEYNRNFIQQAIKNNTGVNLNPLCCGYFGPHKNPTRNSHRYNAYTSLFFKTSDLEELLAKNDLSFSKEFISINDLLELCWELLKDNALVVEVNSQPNKTRKLDRGAVLEKKRLRTVLLQKIWLHLNANEQSYMVAYFFADQDYPLDLKMVGKQLQAFLNNHNIRQINEINYKRIKKRLANDEHKRNLESNRLLIQHAIQNDTGVALNPLCSGYLGPHRNPTRRTHSYNAYDKLYFLTDDLDTFLAKNKLSFPKSLISINALLELCWDLLKDDELVAEVNSKKVEVVSPPVVTPTPTVLPEVTTTANSGASSLEIAVNEALECLDYADLAGYFVAIDAVVPPRYLAIYNQIKNQYMLNGSNAEYLERLKVLAHSMLQ